jgi:hypothetical protein
LELEDKSTDIFERCNPGLKIKLCCSSESAKEVSGFIFTNSSVFIYPENGKKEVGRADKKTLNIAIVDSSISTLNYYVIQVQRN